MTSSSVKMITQRERELGDVARRMPQSARDPDKVSHIKIENCIGFAQVPLGIAGPLTVHGRNQSGTFYAPLATYEPTLVASCARGCKALEASGGVKAEALNEGLSRAPAFTFTTVDEALKFYHHVPNLLDTFRKSGEKTSKYAKLLDIKPSIIGAIIHVKFTYYCGDAAGQNMVTIATHTACQKFLESEEGKSFNVINFLIDGGFSSDKKLSWGSVHEPRGVEVVVWAILKDDVARKMLGASTKDICEAIDNITHANFRNGQMGNNINTCNILTAMFIATGQDPASVAESSFSHLTTDLNAATHDLTLTLYFPSILIGSVGGGTGLATQKEALDLIGCSGAGRKWALAETIAAFALALDLSTVSAGANDTFAKSHKMLARGTPAKL